MSKEPTIVDAAKTTAEGVSTLVGNAAEAVTKAATGATLAAVRRARKLVAVKRPKRKAAAKKVAKKKKTAKAARKSAPKKARKPAKASKRTSSRKKRL
jgi:hypothetical protein